MVAHRLSTIRTADLIVTIKDGVVVEKGTHAELMAKRSLYYSLAMSQVMFTRHNVMLAGFFLTRIPTLQFNHFRTLTKLFKFFLPQFSNLYWGK